MLNEEVLIESSEEVAQPECNIPTNKKLYGLTSFTNKKERKGLLQRSHLKRHIVDKTNLEKSSAVRTPPHRLIIIFSAILILFSATNFYQNKHTLQITRTISEEIEAIKIRNSQLNLYQKTLLSSERAQIDNSTRTLLKITKKVNYHFIKSKRSFLTVNKF